MPTKTKLQNHSLESSFRNGKDIDIKTMPTQSTWFAFIFLASIYFIINFIMTPNTLSPIHQDDYFVLGTNLENVRWFTGRPISANLAYLMGEMGLGFSFFLVNVLTIIVPLIIILFLSKLFNIQFFWYSLLLYGAISFSDFSALEHGKFLGLISSLTSHFFGCLTLLFILDYWKSNNLRKALFAFLTYSLSVFSKEDFLLPPLAILSFLWIEALLIKSELHLSLSKKQVKNVFIFTILLASITLVSLVFSFMVNNPFLYGVTGEVTGSASYAINLNPLILLKAFSKLTFEFIPIPMSLGLISLLIGWILLPNYRHRLILIIVLLIILILPYAVIQNRMLPYRVFAWLPWLAGLTAVVIQTLVNRFDQHQKRGLFYWSIISFSLILTCTVIWQSNTPRLMVANWYKNQQDINKSILITLQQYRNLLAKQEFVGIVGVEGLSPWSHTDGEYLRKKLFFDNHWIIFVNKASIFFTPNQESGEKKFVNVKLKNQMCEFKNLLVLNFDNQGFGKPILSQELCQRTQ